MSYKRPLAATLAFGLASFALYALLLANSDAFVEWAQRTRSGEKTFFLVPIIVAFVFSYVHGTFTGKFWESIGLRAANHGSGKK